MVEGRKCSVSAWLCSGSGSDARLTGTRFRHCKPPAQATSKLWWLSCHLRADISTRFARLHLLWLCLVQLHDHNSARRRRISTAICLHFHFHLTPLNRKETPHTLGRLRAPQTKTLRPNSKQFAAGSGTSSTSASPTQIPHPGPSC